MTDAKIEEVKQALLPRNCTIELHSNVMEIKFEKEEDANWFEDVFGKFQKESAVCCLMPIRPKNAPPKFIFNVKDINKFIELINE
ncbi:MAG TPA: hypothetical protein VK426_02385 [Methanobacterium sp.]|nr:hypothetical protein [Methanobacterium sp.]